MQNSRRRRRHPRSREGAARLPSRREAARLTDEAIPGDELYRLVTAPERGGIELIFLRALLAPEAVPVCREGQEYRWVELAGPPPEELLAPDRPVWNFLTNFQRPVQFSAPLIR